jgi:probable rRNA maturation factor
MRAHASPPGRRLEVIVTDVLGRRRRDPGVGAWLRRAAPGRAAGTMGLVLASDSAVRRLNRRFAGADRATDVLSFPSDARGPARVARPGSYLGDVVVATGVSRRQARAAGHGWATELRILALHGLLHLLGYDHATDRGEMARLERALRRRAGVAEALIERASRAGGPRRGVSRKARP